MPEKNQHAYKLVGVDKEWVHSGTRRYASYPGLSPGRYMFRVKGANNDGIWNEQGASLYFIIHPPFYLTWWFKTLGALITFGLLYSGFRYRVGQIRKEEAQKTEFHRIEEEQKTQFNKKLSQMEMQALQAQMNPHFIFNSLNSINCFILENETEAASDYLSKFSRLIRLILPNSNSSTVSLKNELEALGLYLAMEALRFEGKFTFTIQVDPLVDQDYLQIAPLLIQPYVENAIWHGLMHKAGAGRIHIHLQMDKEVLVCMIEDDGIGRSKAAQLKSKSATRSKSMGMQITSHRLELINYLYGKKSTVEIVDLVDMAGIPGGTRVVLRIPV
jgi:LytS/YehU family sensor histidine kinase